VTAATQWRVPQSLRDLKPHRPGEPEALVAVDRNVGLALLLHKLHGELFEIEEEPDATEEYADFLTVLQSLYEIVAPHWDGWSFDDPAGMPLPLFMAVAAEPSPHPSPFGSVTGDIHRGIERFGRDLLDSEAYVDIVRMLAHAASAAGADTGQLPAVYTDKAKRSGGFDKLLLWHRTDF